MRLDKLSQDDWIVAGVAILLVFDLLFLPWFDQTISAGAQSVSITSTATGAPDGWLGVLALLAVVALLADLAIKRFSPQTQLPMIGGSRAATRTLLAWTGGRIARVQAVDPSRLSRRDRVLGRAAAGWWPRLHDPSRAGTGDEPRLREPDFRRLRRGELVAGASGVLLFVFLFVPAWYSLNGTFSRTEHDIGAGTSGTDGGDSPVGATWRCLRSSPLSRLPVSRPRHGRPRSR